MFYVLCMSRKSASSLIEGNAYCHISDRLQISPAVLDCWERVTVCNMICTSDRYKYFLKTMTTPGLEMENTILYKLQGSFAF